MPHKYSLLESRLQYGNIDGLGVDGYSTAGGRRFGQCSPRLQTCRDIQLQKLELPFYHEQDCFAGSYCDADQLEDDSASCRPRSSCCCYDQLSDKNYEAGKTAFQGCTNWYRMKQNDMLMMPR